MHLRYPSLSTSTFDCSANVRTMVTPPSAYSFAVTPSGSRRHSIAVFGCTGNAGRAVAYQVIKSAAKNKKSINIALSGRNQKKIEEVFQGIKDELKDEDINLSDDANVEIVLADAANESSMLRLAQSTNILVSCGRISIEGNNCIDLTLNHFYLTIGFMRWSVR